MDEQADKRDLVPRKMAGVRQTDLVDGCVLLDEEGGVAYALNVSASLVWEQCDGISTLAEIAAGLGEAAGQRADVVAEDVMKAIGMLRENGLLSLGGAGEESP